MVLVSVVAALALGPALGQEVDMPGVGTSAGAGPGVSEPPAFDIASSKYGNRYTTPTNFFGEDPESAKRFTPVTQKGKIPTDIDRGPFENSALLNPYGTSRAQAAYGRSGVFGGPADMVKSVATRSLAIDELKRQMEKAPMPMGMQQGLESYAAKNPYLSSMLSNYLPSIQSQATIQNQAQKAGLNDLLQGAYALGGGLYGGALQAWAGAKAQDKARRLEHTKAVQSIFQGIGAGIGGGGGGMGGGGGGGGGGDYGITNTTVGLIGVLGSQGII